MRIQSGEKGQSLVEAALVLPMLCLFFMVMLQLIALAWARVLCSHAAQAAARVYTVRHSDDEKKAADLAQYTAARVLSRAWPSVTPQIEIDDIEAGECHLILRAVIPPLWGWAWTFSQGRGLMTVTCDARIQDEATPARLQEDVFRQP